MTDGDVKALKGLFSGGPKVVSIQEMNVATQRVGSSAATYEADGGPLTHNSDQAVAERFQRDPEFAKAILE
jgi:hypothetical protein